MYRFSLIIPLFALLSCNYNKSSNKGDVHDGNDTEIDIAKLSQMKFDYAIDYQDALDMLDVSDLKSINVALDMYKNSTHDSLSRESAISDSMFVALNDLTTAVIQGFYEKNLSNNDELKAKLRNGKSDDEIRAFNNQLKDFGINLSALEGEYYLQADQQFLYNNLKDNLSDASAEFLELQIVDQQFPIAEDGLLLISPDSLAERVKAWENFMVKYPNYISIDEVQNLYAIGLTAFLGGTDNSPAFDFETKMLDNRFKSAFESYMQNNPERKSAQIVKQYYELISANGFKYSDKIGDFLLENVAQ